MSTLMGKWLPTISLDRINNIRRMRANALDPYLAKYGTRQVLIYSFEHGLFWGPNAGGYTSLIDLAGIYTLREAINVSGHCGPEKCIYYAFTPTA